MPVILYSFGSLAILKRIDRQARFQRPAQPPGNDQVKMAIFTEKKDRIVSKGLKTFANLLINDYGKINGFAVNSKDRTITLNVLLKGEKEDLKIIINNYRIVSDNKKAFLQFETIWTSREWLNVFFDKKRANIWEDNKIQIPGYIATPINIIL